jgi:hypothetical protein
MVHDAWTKLAVAAQLSIMSACQGPGVLELVTAEDTVTWEGIEISVERSGLDLTVHLRNVTDVTREFTFAAGCPTTSVVVLGSRVVWDERDGTYEGLRFCADVSGAARLAPGERRTLEGRAPEVGVRRLVRGAALYVRVESRPNPVWVRASGR